MTTENTPARTARIRALVMVGVALLAAGVSSLVTLWQSTFARYMYIEDLGLSEATVFATTRLTPVDRGIIISGGILALLGAAALIAAAVLARRRRRAGR
ncbi:MAG TPA: hypothetical protein VER83_02620 [Candidatus Nanopelagicales bacterium]|nr:hypothetical protein [Candidatus Nanopelagicales bacterium]